MRILLTGASGYIGKRLLPVLAEQGHDIICCVRDKTRFEMRQSYGERVTLFEVDFLKTVEAETAPKDFDIAFYLIHSMSSSISNFEELESSSAENFAAFVSATNCRQVVYLSGISNEKTLSRHLSSRRKVEEILRQGSVPVTVLRAGIIVGSGSASFEIIRDLVEKLPVMITPEWLNTRSQPIAVRDVINFLTGVMLNEKCIGMTFDIGGPEILTYKQMLLGYAEVRKLRRFIITLPVMTPRLSSYWLYFVTSTSYKLAVNLVNSMKVEVVCRDNELRDILGLQTTGYKKAVELAFEKIEQNLVLSSWKDSLVTTSAEGTISEFVEVPTFGVFTDRREVAFDRDVNEVLDNIWSIGGERGWYYANLLWRIRGFLDKLSGGVGLRRGRTSPDKLSPGDALDFWRVLAADKKNRRLLLHAEMKLPGDAWLEFRVIPFEGRHKLIQTATFRPNGLMGRLYWYSILPFHYLIFNRMAVNITKWKD